VLSPSSGSVLYELAKVTVVKKNPLVYIGVVWFRTVQQTHTHTHQGPDNICSHTTRLTTPV